MKISIVKYFALIFFTGYVEWISAQNVISEQAALDSAMKHSPLLKSAELQVKQSNYLRKTAFNLSNPDVIAESPTGDFYAVGILQSIEFPTVYIKQGQLLNQQSLLSEKGKALTIYEVKRLIRSVYLNAQYTQQLYEQLKYQDSLYNQIQISARRQFDAGVIDYLAKTFAESQYGEIHNQLVQAQNAFKANLQQLKLYTGISSASTVSALVKFTLPNLSADTSAVTQSPLVQYARQNQVVNQKQLSLERNRALPGLVVGFLNQGPRETETYYRFRVGFTVPLWFWQYSGNIKAAKTRVQIAEQQTRAQQQQLTADLQTSMSEYTSAQQAVSYYEASGLKQAEDIISAAKRFFESGKIDYIAYIRNINDAYAVKRTYLETLRTYNQSIININYITGNL